MTPTNATNSVPEKIIEYGLIFLIIFTPLAFGSVHVWAYTIVEVVALLMLLTFLVSRFTAHALRPTPRALRLALPLLFFLGLVLFQMVPLPSSAIKHLSPNTYDLYQQTLGNGPAVPPAPRALSIYAHATKTEFLKFFAYLSVFFLIMTTMTTFGQIRRLVLTVIFTGTGVAFLALCQMLSQSDKIYGFWQSQYKVGSYGGPFVNADHLAGYLEMVIPLALGFLVSREVPGISRAAKDWKQRVSLLEAWLAKNILLIFIILIMASALFLSVSRGGILSFVFSLGLFSLLLGMQKSQKGKRKMVLLISVLLFIFLLWMGADPIITKLATLASPTAALADRLPVWKDTLHLSRDFPLLGVGLGNFQTIYPKYTTVASPTFWEHAHNDYVEMLADTGWAGALLFFGGIWFFLFAIMKKWKERKDPFVTGITLGGLTGAVAILFHCLGEFNLHIPANALLLFITLGVIGVTINLRQRPEGEYPPLPVHPVAFSLKVTKALLPLAAVVVVFLLAVAAKDFMAYHVSADFQSAANLANPSGRANPAPLRQAVFLDSGNAEYHNALGNYYARKMTEAWEQGAWKLIQNRWVFMPEENARSYGLKTFHAYRDAVHFSPANAWYHFYLGWTLNELERLSEYSGNPMPPDKSLDARIEFSRARMLDPTNTYIKPYSP